MRIGYRRARDPTQEVSEMIQENNNDDLGQGRSSSKGEKSSDSGYTMKIDLRDVAFGPSCKTRRGIKVGSFISAKRGRLNEE